MYEPRPEISPTENKFTHEDMMPIVMSWAENRPHESPYDIAVDQVTKSIHTLLKFGGNEDLSVLTNEEQDALKAISARVEDARLKSYGEYASEINGWLAANVDDILCSIDGVTHKVTSVRANPEGILPNIDMEGVPVIPHEIGAIWFKSSQENE